jgi:hypothetical protein
VQCLKFLNLSSNRLSGSLDKDLCPHCIAVFDVSGNELPGSVPSCVTKKRCASQVTLDDSPYGYSSFLMSKALAELCSVHCNSGECSAVYHNFANKNFQGHLTPLPFGADSGNRTIYAFLVDQNSFTGSLDFILLEHCSNMKGLIISF